MTDASLPSTAEPRARWTRFASPVRFEALASRLAPWCWAVAVLAGLAGLYVGFIVAPTDATQGEAYRILFIHVPAAWLSMICYLAIAFWAVIGWVLKARMASRLARALAPSGALYTAMACAWVLFFPFLSILGLWALYWLHHKATPTVLSVEHQEAQRLTPRLEPPQTFWGRVLFWILVVFVLAALTVPLALYTTTVFSP